MLDSGVGMWKWGNGGDSMNTILEKMQHAGLMKPEGANDIRAEVSDFSEVSFSIYGNFTPITVRSSSIAKDVHVERNRPED